MRQPATRSATAAWEPPRTNSADLHRPQPATPLTAERRQKTSGHTDQEQIQMIATAIGTPKPSAPKIAGTNSESRLA
jgi:hypothetical protein